MSFWRLPYPERMIAPERQAPRPGLQPLLEARSVAIVGASSRPGSFGNALLREVVSGGFAGPVYPVNPRYQEVMGLRAFRSLAELPERADLALLAVGAERVTAQLRAAAEAAIPAAVVYAGMGGGADAQLREIASAAGLVVCGSNCMGFLNLEHSLRACAYGQPRGLRPGPVAFISHSGSAFSAVVHNGRAVRFNVVVSAGTELSVTMDRYADYALSLPSTRAIALFMETSRDPAGLRHLLRRAAEQDVPVVCLKVGKNARSRQFVATHSGAMAGEDAAYDAVFEAYGVLRVADLDEMMDTLELMTVGRRPGPGNIAAVTDSGGERALLADVAAAVGVTFAEVGQGTLARLREIVPPSLVPDNPLDAWDALEGAEQVFAGALLALHDDPAVCAVALCVDLTAEELADALYTKVALGVQAAASKPVLVVCHVSSAVDRGAAARLREAGVPVLVGTRSGLAAVRHAQAYRDARARPRLAPPAVDPAVTRRWRDRLASRHALSVTESFQLLSDYGIPVVPTLAASSAQQAAAAGERVGWPVVLKTAAADVAHKTEAGGVRLGLAGPGPLAAAYAEMARALGPHVTVSRSAGPGVELALGIVRDPQFGPLVMAGAGGVLVELLADRAFALPPLDAGRAGAMLGNLKAGRLLGGFRTVPACDVTAVASAIVRLSALAADVGDLVSELDINPLIAGPSGCVAVDVLVRLDLPARRAARRIPGRGVCCACARPGQSAHAPAFTGRLPGCRASRGWRWRAAHPGGGPRYRAAKVRRGEQHPAHGAGAGPGLRDQPQHGVAAAAHPGAPRPGRPRSGHAALHHQLRRARARRGGHR